MNYTINNIDHRIEELKKHKRDINAKIKKIKKYSDLVPITDGPDRGYSRTVWHDDAAAEVHDKLQEEWRRIDTIMTRLREAKRHLDKAHQLLEKYLQVESKYCDAPSKQEVVERNLDSIEVEMLKHEHRPIVGTLI